MKKVQSTCVKKLSKKKCLRFNTIFKIITYWEINQVTSKCQTDFLDNTCKKGLKQNKQTSPSNFTYSNKSAFQTSASTNNFGFWKQICHKKENR